ncbi:MAG: flagellar hook-basal body complex protein FliE [Candidatus Korobacteraceae bacterium]
MSNTITGASVQPLIYEPRPAAQTGLEPQSGGFADVLRDAVDQVDQLQASSDQQVGSLLQGEHTDVHNVMIAIEKADVAFQLMMQVRNKIVNAYQQVSQMQF